LYTAPYCTKASPSATSITAANVFGSNNRCNKHHGISLKYLILSTSTWFTNHCLLCFFFPFNS